MTEKERLEPSAESPEEETSRLPEDKTGEDEIESLKRALSEEQAKSANYLANWQRTQADLSNYKRRAEQERTEIARFGNASLTMSLLPVVDDLERALANVSGALAELTWVDGIRLIHRKLLAVLESHAVTEIKALAEDFDPNLHEAVIHADGEEGKVVEVLQKGYKLHDRVLRPALVKVGNGNVRQREPTTQ
ncbi:MAG: nucleotide exchange factor GrpE [Chloroflexi bacterium]|nr:nucleotide exchange factor GrpE [Chloroflexota bacterium]